MDDLISRQAAIDALDEQIKQCDKSLSSFDISMKDEYAVKVEKASLVAFREILEYLPPAQPERIRGRWISADAIFGGEPFYCSECGENTRDTVMGKPRWNFCPNCGAEMEVTT